MNHRQVLLIFLSAAAICALSQIDAVAQPQRASSTPLIQSGSEASEARGDLVSFAVGLDARDFVRQSVPPPMNDGTPAAVVLSVEDSMRLRYQSMHFFPVPQPGDGYRWVVVGRMTIHPADDFQVRTVFADAGTCPGVLDMLALAEQLEMPVIDLPDVPVGTGPLRRRDDRYSPDVALHGLDYELAARSLFYDTDTLAHIRISGSDNTPLAAWGRATMAVLEPCWASRLPADVTSPQ